MNAIEWDGSVAHTIRHRFVIFSGTEQLGCLPAGFTANVLPGRDGFETTKARFLRALTRNPPKSPNALAYFEVSHADGTNVVARYMTADNLLVWTRHTGGMQFPETIER